MCTVLLEGPAILRNFDGNGMHLMLSTVAALMPPIGGGQLWKTLNPELKINDEGYRSSGDREGF